MKLLLYCTKGKPYLYKTEDTTYPAYPIGYHTDKDLKLKLSNTNELANLNGKIVAECDFEVEKLQIVYGKGWETKTIKGTENIEKLTCLNRDKLYQYCKGNGYAIHIKNLHIFDEPRELNEYYRYYSCSHNPIQPIKVAPQNMMYAYNFKVYGEYILISIRPQWLCKILNREKTVEIRKKVLKEMLE